MARTQSFDRSTVVRAARTLFWHTGYADASIPALEAATGLSRSSIYNTFGSKRGLFDAAVQNYLDEVIRPRLAPLTAATVPTNAITDYLLGLRDAFQDLDSMAANNGCLLINAAGSPIADDSHMARVIADYRSELSRAFGRGIAAHRSDLTADQLTQQTETTTGLVIAAFALARIDPEQAADSVRTALDALGRAAA